MPAVSTLEHIHWVEGVWRDCGQADHVSFGRTSSAEWVESVGRSCNTNSDAALLLRKLATVC